MKTLTTIVFLCILSFVTLAKDADSKTLMGKFTGTISVTADGQVSKVELNNFQGADMRAFLTNQVKNWKLEPMKINGKPVNATAPFSFDFHLVEHADSRKIKNAYFRNVNIEPTELELNIQKLEGKQLPKDDVLLKPIYPIAALRAGAQAKVEIVMKINPDGSMAEVNLLSMSLLGLSYKSSDALIARWQEDFTNSAVSAVKLWQPSKEKLKRGDCMNGCVTAVLIDYTIDNGTWYSYLEVPVPKAAWLFDEVIKSDLSKTSSQLVRFKEDPSNMPLDIGS